MWRNVDGGFYYSYEFKIQCASIVICALMDIVMCALICQIVHESKRYLDYDPRETAQLRPSTDLPDSTGQSEEEAGLRKSLLGLSQTFASAQQLEAVKATIQWLSMPVTIEESSLETIEIDAAEGSDNLLTSVYSINDQSD